MRIERALTIDELAERLALPRSTIYYWVRDLPIPGSGSGGAWPESARRKGTRAMQRKYRLLREGAYREALLQYDELVADPSFRDFVCLYLAEGYKRARNSVALCNSDPAVVVLGMRWMRRLSNRRPEVSIQYHADQDLSLLCSIWAVALEIDASSIRVQRKSNSNQLRGRQWRSKHGVVTVRVNDTLLRARLEAWMLRLRETWL
jgi:excisionase family DNA binding protein